MNTLKHRILNFVENFGFPKIEAKQTNMTHKMTLWSFSGNLFILKICFFLNEEVYSPHHLEGTNKGHKTNRERK